MAMFVCEHCGKELDLPPSRIRCGRKYCSPQCKVAASKTKVGPGKVELACVVCGTLFLTWKSKVGRRKYCGDACRHVSYKERVGEKSLRWGKKHTAESRAKISQTRMERGVAQKGPNHSQWKGGRFLANHYFYVMIGMLPEDQQKIAREMRPKHNYILEHRLIMAMTLGRPLKPREVVHHKNGVKTDNRPENLALMAWDEHSRKHRQVERQLAALTAENAELKSEIARLKSLLATSRSNGSVTSSLPERI
jgi:hypothetical protein